MDEADIKVTDNRIFTDDGELREEFRHLESESVEPGAPRKGPKRREEAAGPERPAAPTQAGPERARRAGPRARPAPGAYSPSFLDLVAVLAEPVALFLGDVKLPDGQSAEDLERARLYIDLLGVLKEKSAGNLEPMEAATLEDLLYRLRLRYVEKAG